MCVWGVCVGGGEGHTRGPHGAGLSLEEGIVFVRRVGRRMEGRLRRWQCRNTFHAGPCHPSRHPASGYVQGINDLVTPFLAVFMSEYCEGSMHTWAVDGLSPDKVCWAGMAVMRCDREQSMFFMPHRRSEAGWVQSLRDPVCMALQIKGPRGRHGRPC